MIVGPVEVIVYKMRLFAFNRTKFACSSIAEQYGIIRNVVELGGGGVAVDGESGTPTEVHAEGPETVVGLSSDKSDDCSKTAHDFQPPWQKGLWWVDTE
jgi:hypothetical protein